MTIPRTEPTPRTEEPVAISGAIMGVLVSGLGLLVLFGVPLSPDQVGGVTTFFGAVIIFVGFLVRRRVRPISSDRGDGSVNVAGSVVNASGDGAVVRKVEATPRRGIPTS